MLVTYWKSLPPFHLSSSDYNEQDLTFAEFTGNNLAKIRLNKNYTKIPNLNWKRLQNYNTPSWATNIHVIATLEHLSKNEFQFVFITKLLARLWMYIWPIVPILLWMWWYKASALATASNRFQDSLILLTNKHLLFQGYKVSKILYRTWAVSQTPQSSIDKANGSKVQVKVCRVGISLPVFVVDIGFVRKCSLGRFLMQRNHNRLAAE